MVGRILRTVGWFDEKMPQEDLGKVELTTVVTEIEAVLNSRPLTYVYSDIEDGPPLTPSHFLCGHRLITVPHLQNQSSVDSDYQPGSDTKQLKKRAQYH